MWLLMPAAGLLAVICCLNGYIVYRRICDKTSNADQQYQHRSLKRQSSDLVHSVKEWTESSTGQVLVAGVVIVVCLYIALDSRTRAHPEVLLPFLVISLCSIGGFLTYRFLACAKMRQSLADEQLQHQQHQQQQRNKFQGDSAAEFTKPKWYDSWQKQSNKITTVLVFAVGLASFQQSIKSFSAGTQLMLTSSLIVPVCCLAGFMMYLSSLPDSEATSAEQLQQNKHKLAAGLGMLLAFSAGFLGLKSNTSGPVLPVACFGLPLCCLAGFWMYRYQLYCQPKVPWGSPTDTPPRPEPDADQPTGSLAASPDHYASRERLRQNSDIFMAGHQTGARSPYATRHSQEVVKGQEWGPVQSKPDRPYADLQGLYVSDMPDGEEHHNWQDGSEYYGEWRDGQPNGRGIFVSQSGDRYEGEWEDGKEHGAGTAVASDGSSFFGTWVHGKRHGEGVHKPASADNNRADIIFLRDYDHGVMSNETVLRMAGKDNHRKAIKKDKSRKLQEKKTDQSLPKPGEHIFKGHRSYDLMRELQLGIMFSIANASKSRMSLTAKDVTQEAFGLEVSQYLRSHNGSSFKWKDYSPLVFQRLRQLFGIDNMDYLLSLTGDRALRLLASPGKSGSAFFLSDDDRFLIKTVQQEEMRLLLDLIPKYYRHVETNPGTLLTRFHGLHMVKPVGGAKSRARFVVMGNVFPTDVRLHRRYDLKGSTLGRTSARKAGDPNTVLKDLDIDFQLVLNAAIYDQLMGQLGRDCALLESLRVMDYSLLLGVHYLSWGADQWIAPQIKKVGSGISRAAATAHNPLHWFSGGHTHVYPRCDNDESAPVTPSAGMTASSDAGVVSMVSSIDDSALKGAPMSPGHVAFGADAIPNGGLEAGSLAKKASLALQQPLQGDSRQHSWTAGRPAPKYQPPANPILTPARLHPVPGTSSGLQPLEEEEQSQARSPSMLSPRQMGLVHSAMKHNISRQPSDASSLWQNGHMGQLSTQSRQPVFTAYPQLDAPPTHTQTDRPQPPSQGWGLHPDAATDAARQPPLNMQSGLQFTEDSTFASSSGRQNTAQLSAQSQFEPPQAVSPFESVAEIPFTPRKLPRSIVTTPQSDRVRFNDNPVFTPLDTPEGLAYRHQQHDQHQHDGQIHVNGAGLFQDEGQMSAIDRRLFRTRSAPLRPRNSMKGASSSPTKQDLHAFEELLEGTGAHMPEHLQLLATYSSSQDERLLSSHQPVPCRIGTDDATGSMRRLYSRRCRDRPGVSIPALAIPRDGSKPEPVLIYFGIIDFLQEYRTKKKMEHVVKAAVFGGKTISVVDPHRYAKRFRGFMEELFVRK